MKSQGEGRSESRLGQKKEMVYPIFLRPEGAGIMGRIKRSEAREEQMGG